MGKISYSTTGTFAQRHKKTGVRSPGFAIGAVIESSTPIRSICSYALQFLSGHIHRHFSVLNSVVGIRCHPHNPALPGTSLLTITSSVQLQYMAPSISTHVLPCAGHSGATGPAQRVPADARTLSATTTANRRKNLFMVSSFLSRQTGSVSSITSDVWSI